MNNGKIRHYSNKQAYLNSVRGMFANQYQKKNHTNKIQKAKNKRQMKHKGVGRVSSGKKKLCETCKREGKDLTKGKCKVCVEEFASFKQPEQPKKQKDLHIGVEERSHKIRPAIEEDNSNIGNIFNTDPEFRKRVNRQRLEGVLRLHSGWVNSVGREEAIRDFNESDWGDAYFVLWGYQNGDNHAFLENKIGDRYVLLRNDRNDHDFRFFENGDIFQLDTIDQIHVFDYQNRGFGVMFWDIQELRSQGRKLYEGGDFLIRPVNIPMPEPIQMGGVGDE
jgi:hypothetical protein